MADLLETHVHLFKPSPRGDARTLLLLHGTGDDERSFSRLGAVMAPEAAVLSVRGNVLDNGMNRFFRRRAEGVYDMEDLARRTTELHRLRRRRSSPLRARPHGAHRRRLLEWRQHTSQHVVQGRNGGARGGSDASPDPLRAARQSGARWQPDLDHGGRAGSHLPARVVTVASRVLSAAGSSTAASCSIPVVTSWCRRRSTAPAPLSLKQHRLHLRTRGRCPELRRHQGVTCQ